MMKISCPWCGERSQDEFEWCGPFPLVRPVVKDDPVNNASDAEWADYLYMRDNTKGFGLERWRHTHGCGEWLVAERNSATHEIKKVMAFDEAVALIQTGEEAGNGQ